MCGICGIFDLKHKNRVESDADIKRMTSVLFHRGPDSKAHYVHGNLAFGFSRLSIIDVEGGMQPMINEDGSCSVVCNGEIFNYIELREELIKKIKKGHRLKTRSDVEVLIHLYEEKGTDFLNQLNGQFAFAIFDLKKQQLFCAGDHFGVIPFFYTITDDFFIFGSEIKAILEHPRVKKTVDCVGLDQVFSFPGLISPRTMFKHIRSLENGHYLVVKDSVNIEDVEYWDLVYPEKDKIDYDKDEKYYIEQLEHLIYESVRLRLRADVPVGLYISGGLDSSIVAAMTHKLTNHNRRNSFAIDFLEKETSESKYQRIMSTFINSAHREILFRFTDISERLPKTIYHSECALKETYNTASLALSESVRAQDIKVILTGEGADEFFAGYVGYRFDKLRQMQTKQVAPDTPFEDEIRRRLWGDENFFYEKNQYAFKQVKKELYSEQVNENFEAIDCLNHYIVKKERLKNRHILHKRSYLDYKLHLADHLISDHGDRMAMANSVAVRYPFLDEDLVEFAAVIPPELKLKDFEEKYILKRMASDLLPEEIVKREKFGFVAPGSPYLLKRDIEYINDLLSYERIKRQGFFNPNTVVELKKQYTQDGFSINVPFDGDLLIIVITFGIFLEKFQMTDLI
jgi:asparagine synthase (glutamine-hydrolysing)